MHKSARDAYRSYLLAYASHSHKHIFDVHALDLQKVAKSFGFTVPPKVNLNVSAKGTRKRTGSHTFYLTYPREREREREREQRERPSLFLIHIFVGCCVWPGFGTGWAKQKGGNNQHASKGATGHTFSAQNPYGKREKSDSRQFVKF